MGKISVIAAVSAILIFESVFAGPLYSQSSSIWDHAHSAARTTQQKETLMRWRRETTDYENFGSFGAIMEFGDSVNKNVTVSCTACKAAAEALRYFLGEGYGETELLSLLHSICMDFKIMTKTVCDGFTVNVGPEIIVVVNSTTLTPLQICSFLVGDSCGDVSNPSIDWNVELPPVTKPPVQIPTFPPEGLETIRVLHISDTHMDLLYEEGAPAVCSEPLCCRVNSGAIENNTKLAGKWGDWKCDTPLRTLENMLEHAANTHKDLDYIIWTGDLPAHDIWDQNKENMLYMVNLTANLIKNAFPGVPVYPAIGNHDSAPVNSFPGPEIGGKWNISWLYDAMLDAWESENLSSNEISQTIRKGAFYSTLARPGLRIISLNMNYCYLSNWWLMVNSTDPAQELSWLTEELQKAEYAGEKVHILGHIPPGHTDCLITWTKVYANLITRYEGTIMAQFFGHTHKDEFEIYYDVSNTSRPVAVSYVGPSVTTFTDLNPGYRVYTIDGDRPDSTRMVLDYETWIFDLDEANAKGEPEWRKSFSVREAYGMNSLLPTDWDDLYQRFKTDDDLFALYYKYYTKESPVRSACTSDECKRGKLCAIRSCQIYPN